MQNVIRIFTADKFEEYRIDKGTWIGCCDGKDLIFFTGGVRVVIPMKEVESFFVFEAKEPLLVAKKI